MPRLLLSSALLDQGGPQLWIHTFWNYSQGFFPILDCWGYSASAYCGVPVCLLHDRSLSLASSKAILQQWAEQMLNIWMCTCVGVVLFDFFVCLFCVSIMFWQGGIWGLGGGVESSCSWCILVVIIIILEGKGTNAASTVKVWSEENRSLDLLTHNMVQNETERSAGACAVVHVRLPVLGSMSSR